MKCFIEHHGMNFSKAFGPFDSVDDAIAWLQRPDVRKAGVQGVITPMVSPDHDFATMNVWDVDEYDEAAHVSEGA